MVVSHILKYYYSYISSCHSVYCTLTYNYQIVSLNTRAFISWCNYTDGMHGFAHYYNNYIIIVWYSSINCVLIIINE